MKLNLYQYCMLLHPKEKDGEFEGETTMLIEPRTVLAKDEKQAAIKIARKIPDNQMENLDRIDIVVRPFQ